MQTKFDYNDIVRVRAGATPELRPGTRAWVVGIFDQRRGSYFDSFPPGQVYTIEFEDGSSTEAHESELELDTEET